MSPFLPEIASLGLEVFVFPIAATMWLGTPEAAAITFFWFLVRVGFSIKNPLEEISILTRYDDFVLATKYYGGYFVLLIVFGLMVGYFLKLVYDLKDTIAFRSILPSFETYNVDNVVATPCNPDVRVIKAALIDYYCNCVQHSRKKDCFTHIETNYWFVVTGLFSVLMILFVPHLIFWGLLPINRWAALFLAVGMLLVLYFLNWLYHSYRTDLSTWGASLYNMTPRIESIKKDPYNSIYASDPDISVIADSLYIDTQSRITRNTLVKGFVHISGFLLIGGIIAIPTTPDLNLVWPIGLAYICGVLLIFGLIAFINYFNRKDQAPICGNAKYCPKTGKLLSVGEKKGSSSLGSKKPVDASEKVNSKPVRSGKTSYF